MSAKPETFTLDRLAYLCWLLLSSGLFLAQNIDQPTRQHFLKNKGEI
jgi:hypothetical protein